LAGDPNMAGGNPWIHTMTRRGTTNETISVTLGHGSNNSRTYVGHFTLRGQWVEVRSDYGRSKAPCYAQPGTTKGSAAAQLARLLLAQLIEAADRKRELDKSGD
jgi:hypothetical protein